MTLLLNLVVIVLLVGVGVLLVAHQRRIRRLQDALAEGKDLLPALDAATQRLGDSTGAFSQRIQRSMEEVDNKAGMVRRMAGDLATATRNAEELVLRLEDRMRASRKMERAYAGAMPAALAEPKGFSERQQATVSRVAFAEPAARPALAPIVPRQVIEPEPANLPPTRAAALTREGRQAASLPESSAQPVAGVKRVRIA